MISEGWRLVYHCVLLILMRFDLLRCFDDFAAFIDLVSLVIDFF